MKHLIMIEVLLVGAISIIGCVASDDNPIPLSPYLDNSVSLEPHESQTAHQHINAKQGYVWNRNHGGENSVNHMNIHPWEYQQHYSGSFGNRHDGYGDYTNKNSNEYGNLMAFRDDLISYNSKHKFGADYQNVGYGQSSTLPMKLPTLPNYNKLMPNTNELYKSNYSPRNNIYNHMSDIGGNLYSNELNFNNMYPPQHRPEYLKHYNIPEELLLRPNNLARKIDYKYLSHSDPYRHRYLGSEIAENQLISGKNMHNFPISNSENYVNSYNDGYKPLSLVKESIYQSTPYINSNLGGNPFNTHNDYRQHSTHVGLAPKLSGEVQSLVKYKHPYVNHGTNTIELHHNYSHDGWPRQAYRHFKDVAVAVKDLVHHGYNRYHAHPRLRHYGKIAHTETIGVLMPHKVRLNPYILPEYRRYNFNDEYAMKY